MFLHFPTDSFLTALFRAFLGNDDDSTASEPKPKQGREGNGSSPSCRSEIDSGSPAQDVPPAPAAPTPHRPVHTVRKPVAVRPATSKAIFPGPTPHPAGTVGIVPSNQDFLPPEPQAPERLYVKMELAELTPRARSTPGNHEFSTPQSHKRHPKLEQGQSEWSEDVGAALKTLNMGKSSVFVIFFR